MKAILEGVGLHRHLVSSRTVLINSRLFGVLCGSCQLAVEAYRRSYLAGARGSTPLKMLSYPTVPARFIVGLPRGGIRRDSSLCLSFRFGSQAASIPSLVAEHSEPDGPKKYTSSEEQLHPMLATVYFLVDTLLHASILPRLGIDIRLSITSLSPFLIIILIYTSSRM